MAIQKTKTLSTGVVANYWKITKVSLDVQNLKCTWTISLFLNSANSDNASLLDGKIYTFNCTPLEMQGDLVSLGYTKITARASEMVSFLGGPETTFDPDIAGGVAV